MGFSYLKASRAQSGCKVIVVGGSDLQWWRTQSLASFSPMLYIGIRAVGCGEGDPRMCVGGNKDVSFNYLKFVYGSVLDQNLILTPVGF